MLTMQEVMEWNMSIDRCSKCDEFVDTDADPDCYYNEKEVCLCEPCREDLPEQDVP